MDEPKEVSMEVIKEKLSSVDKKVDAHMKEVAEKIDAFGIHIDQKIESLRDSCPLVGYNLKMNERIERFNDRLSVNIEKIENQKDYYDEKIDGVESVLLREYKNVDDTIKKTIISGVTICLAFLALFGTLYFQKINNSEMLDFKTHYNLEKVENVKKYNRFWDNYIHDRELRDEKIDRIFQKQLDFNAKIMEQNSLLGRQLEVLKTKINIK